MKLYQVHFFEVLGHRAFIEAADPDEAKAVARKYWDEERARFHFDTFTAGRCLEITCKETPVDPEVRS